MEIRAQYSGACDQYPKPVLLFTCLLLLEPGHECVVLALLVVQTLDQRAAVVIVFQLRTRW